MSRKFIIFDTEFTSWKGCLENGRLDWQKEEIVQIAAIKVDENTLSVVDELNLYVKSVMNPILSDYFINLTGLTNELIEARGISFEQAYNEFKQFSEGLSCYSYNAGSEKSLADGDIMRKNLSFNDMKDEKEPHYINIANWFKKAFAESGFDMGNVNSGGIAKKLGVQNLLQDSGIDEHNALYDVYSLLAGVRYFKAKGIQLLYL